MVELRDHQGIIRRFSAFTDKGQSEALGRQIQRLVNTKVAGEQPEAQLSHWLEGIPAKLRDKLVSIGVLDGSRAAAGKAIAKHIDDFEQALLSKNDTPRHARLTANRVRRIMQGCKFAGWSDLQASRVEKFLADLRDRGLSVQSSNFYLQSVRQFAKWMILDGRASLSPVEHLKGLNVQTDRRHDRRALSPDEVRRLLENTKAEPLRFGMSGNERALLYLLAIESGLRVNELRSLKIQDFDFDALTVSVSAGYSKHRQKDVLPLRAETAAQLQVFCANKRPTAKIFGGTRKELTKRTSDMISADLEACGIAYVDDSGRFADFHSLRHTTGSLLAASGVHPKIAQVLMRHSTVDLTLSRYTHIFAGQTSEAIGKLPDFSLPGKRFQKAKATGTDSKSVIGDSENPQQKNLARHLALQAGQPPANMDTSGQEQGNRASTSQHQKSTLTQSKTAISGQKRRGRDSNPRGGFKPTGRFSKPLPSATRPPLQIPLRRF